MPGAWFITLEGGEGVGKSTQARLLADRLRGAGRLAITTREPGGSTGAEAIRHLLLSGATDDLGPAAQALLISAGRADHVEKTIRPALDAGTDVVCDRFIDSTRVYQGLAGGLDPGWVALLQRLTIGPYEPHLTLVLDLVPSVALARAAARVRDQVVADRFERQTLAFHERVRAGFLDIAAGEPERCAVVDASGTPEAIAAAIWEETQARLLERPGGGSIR